MAMGAMAKNAPQSNLTADYEQISASIRPAVTLQCSKVFRMFLYSANGGWILELRAIWRSILKKFWIEENIHLCLCARSLLLYNPMHRSADFIFGVLICLNQITSRPNQAIRCYSPARGRAHSCFARRTDRIGRS